MSSSTTSPITTNERILFKSQPSGKIEPGNAFIHDASEKIDLDNVPLNGGVLLKLLVVSPDPGQRLTLLEDQGQEHQVSSMPLYKKGSPIRAFALGVVLRSENAGAKPGDYIHSYTTLENYVILPNLDAATVLKPDNLDIPWTAYLGVLGMPGQTAWMAWKEYSKARKGETVFVSAAAGPVGSFVVQLAKRDGLKVIASAGSEDKLAWLKNDLGADVVFNYKTTSTLEVLKREGGIDIYWDNVGGETLDAALEAAKTGARIIACGMISGYNSGFAPTKNLWWIFPKGISIHGFLVSMLWPKYLEEFYATVPALVANGEIKYKETVYKGKGLAAFEEALIAIFEGAAMGKVVVALDDV